MSKKDSCSSNNNTIFKFFVQKKLVTFAKNKYRTIENWKYDDISFSVCMVYQKYSKSMYVESLELLWLSLPVELSGTFLSMQGGGASLLANREKSTGSGR